MVTPTHPPADEGATGAARAVRLLQFGDSTFPVGSFTFSNALEAAIQEGVVSDADTLRAFVRTGTRRAATVDGVALLETHRAARAELTERIVAIDHALLARKLNEEARTQTVRMGKKLVEVASTVLGSPMLAVWLTHVRRGLTVGTYPVALGVVCADLGLPERDSFAIHQYGVAATMLNAALRLMRIDHVATQTILFDANAQVDRDYADVSARSIADMAAFAPLTDVLAAAHVRSHVRMFMT